MPLVEEGWINDSVTDTIIHRYLDELVEKGIDSLVLGCTHYPILKHRIQEAVGPGVTLVNPAFESARAFKYVLEENNLLNERPDAEPTHRFYVSDSEELFRAFAQTIIPEAVLSPEAVGTISFD